MGVEVQSHVSYYAGSCTEALHFLQRVLGSTLLGDSHGRGYSWFPSVHPSKYWDFTPITPRAVHSVCFIFHHSRPVILPFDAIHSFKYLRLHMQTHVGNHPLKYMLYVFSHF
jgi:hypothetical protein